MANSSRVELVPGYVLHGRAYRETSQILELFTAEHGRVGVVARGSRRPKSALRGLLNPFQPLRLSWSGRGELATLTQAEFGGVAVPLAGSAVMSGFYVNELLLKLLGRHDPHPDLFVHYSSLIAALGNVQGQSELLEGALRQFEMQLLNEIGYAPNFEVEAHTHAPLDPEAMYEFHLETGVVPLSVAADRQDAYLGRVLLAIAQFDFTGPETLRAAKSLLRTILNFHLGDRGLQTRSVASAMKR